MDNYIYYIIGFAAVIALFFASYKVFGINKIKEWLVWAVSTSEKKFGSGTGKLKLTYVYDQFIAKFPKLQAIIPYYLFSILVDKALVAMREMLENDKIAEFIINKSGGDVND